jgi:hypothetical protein
MCKEWIGVIFLDKSRPIIRKAKELLEDPLSVGERPPLRPNACSEEEEDGEEVEELII